MHACSLPGRTPSDAIRGGRGGGPAAPPGSGRPPGQGQGRDPPPWRRRGLAAAPERTLIFPAFIVTIAELATVSFTDVKFTVLLPGQAIPSAYAARKPAADVSVAVRLITAARAVGNRRADR